MWLNKELFYKFIKYSSVGMISTMIYFVSVFILIEFLDQKPIFSTSISFIIMTIVAFYLNKKYIFGGAFSLQRLFRFLTVSTIGFILNFLIIYFVVDILLLHYTIGELITVLIIPIVNFLLNNFWTFKETRVAE